jgi:DNA sulfur modification protein DndC
MIRELIKRNALFVVNHSGGKDSQAMLIRLARIIPHNQLVIVHAHLPEVEWENTMDHINATSFGIPVYEVTAVKTFFQMVRHRKKFPDPQRRQCTSDLKRGPLEKLIRSISRERNNKLIVNCMGMRAQESPGRSKKTVFKLNEGNSVAGREWYDWLPIHKMTTDQVFSTIEKAGQKPFWVYAAGMTRKSCCFCIMASRNDLQVASELRPELKQKYIDLQKEIGQTLLMPVKGREKNLETLLQ